MTTVSQPRMAALAGVSSQRITQLLADGVIEKKGNGFDPVDSLSRIIKWMRRDDAGTAARLQAIQAATALKNTKTKVMLAQLVTLDELKPVYGKLFNIFNDARQRYASEIYYAVKVSRSEAEAKQRAGDVDGYLRNELKFISDTWSSAVDRAGQGLVTDGRIEAEFERLLSVARPDAETPA